MTKEQTTPLLTAQEVVKHYPIRQWFWEEPRWVQALNGVSFKLDPRETLALVGESGCGKSTLAKTLIGLEPLTSGEVIIDQKDLKDYKTQERCQKIQMIFQDPYSSLNPRKKINDIVGEPLTINTNLSKSEVDQRVAKALEKVGLRPEFANRYPHMFSGGQRQRIGIARALVMQPQIMICDEPVSALDISIQAQVLNLLMDLQESEGLSYLFISHDLSVVRHISHRVIVMYLGKVVEMGNAQEVFENPSHPYTQLLIESTPSVHRDKKTVPLKGASELPSPLNLPTGCAFHKRCPFAKEQCTKENPSLRSVGDRDVACHLV